MHEFLRDFVRGHARGGLGQAALVELKPHFGDGSAFIGNMRVKTSAPKLKTMFSTTGAHMSLCNIS